MRFLNYLRDTSSGHIRGHDDYPEFRRYGDWLALDGSGKTDGGTPSNLIGTAFYAYSAQLLSRIARILGKGEDATHYEELCEDIRIAVNREFVTPAARVAGGTQTGYVLALHFDVLPEEVRAAAAAELIRDIMSRGTHLATGFVGTPYLPHVQTSAGHLDVSYQLLFQKTWPSWLYAGTQGATTIWERWDGWTDDRGVQDAGMNSFNHYAYGAIGDWLYSKAAGIDIDPAALGYKHIILRPHPGGGITSARAIIHSIHGKIVSDWKIADGTLTWNVSVPANTRATVHVLVSLGATTTESGQPIEQADGVHLRRDEAGMSVYAIGGGDYSFRVVPAPK